MKGNGQKKSLKPTARDLRLAGAIGQAVQESLGPKIDAVSAEIRQLRADHGEKLDGHGKKLDQLIRGAVGVGRIRALEQRVTDLERQR